MGIILGFLCLICLCFLLVKAIVHKIGWKKADDILMQVHKYLCAAFIVFCSCHIIFVFPVLKTRYLAVSITGIAVALIFLLIVVIYHKATASHKNMLHWHRRLSVILFIGVLTHILVYYIDFGTYKNKVSNIQLQDIQVDSMKDGSYIGESDVGYIYAKISCRCNQRSDQFKQSNSTSHSRCFEQYLDELKKVFYISINEL